MKKALLLAVALFLLTPIQARAEQVGEVSEEEFWDGVSYLMLCVEAEAGNQDMMGKRLVAAVVLNRVDSEKFPNTITEVIQQKKQFSTYANGAIDRVVEVPESTREAVLLELEQRSDTEIMFFTAGRYNGSGKPAYKYGSHYFSTL